MNALLAECISAEQQLSNSAALLGAEGERLLDAASTYDAAFGAVSSAEGYVAFHFPDLDDPVDRIGPAGKQCLVHALDDFLQRSCAYTGCCLEGLCQGSGS